MMNTLTLTRFVRLSLALTLCGALDSSIAAQQTPSAPQPGSTETSGKDDKNGDSADKADDARPERRVIRIIGDTKLDVRHWPLLGKPDAKYVFVEMFDYTCPHCRDMHHEIDAAFKKFGDDLAVLALPIPLNATCNDQVGTTESQHRESCELANLAVAVWRLKPDKYHEYHD
ncbi:MAG: thioredoxin domain-containing protein [Planctomycetota bacterium]|nr:thioredoxin domain-containing protein [Planctomycetota bacterium]